MNNRIVAYMYGKVKLRAFYPMVIFLYIDGMKIPFMEKLDEVLWRSEKGKMQP